MPKKYQKPKNKNRRYTHNRPYYGKWWSIDKEERKECRKKMKGLRHKLLFHIPLTEDEAVLVRITGLTAESAIDSNGNVCGKYGMVKKEDGSMSWERIPHTGKSKRWRFMNPKEMREKYGKPQKEVDKRK